MYSQMRRCIGKSVIQTQQRSMSFKVRVGAFEPPKAPIAERQRVQQTWCLSGDKTLEKLRVATPGLTYISVAPPSFFDEMAQSQNTSSNQLSVVARVSSDAQSLLERVDVLPGSNHLLIGFDPRPPRGWPVEDAGEPGKHLLTEIFVREVSELRTVGVFGGGSLVVTDSEQGSALVNDRPYGKLKLAAFGSRVFVNQEHELRLGRVSLFAGRGGQIYLSAPEITAKDRIRIAAGRWGESKILVQTPTLSTFSLGAAVTGSGSIRFASTSDEIDCRCEKQTLVIAGNGTIDTGDITSRYGRVAILGSGSATLQASETMTVGTLGSGRVNYLEPGPEVVRGSTSSLRALSAAAKAQHNEDQTSPTRESAFEDTGYSLNPWWWARRSFGFYPRNKKRDDYGYTGSL
ncbi:hypothetical protein V7S43_018060 [Phytophthora oleae]|uniref:Auto-transporter adhesin head GIN domain-containing protein n=1 Tax=Phytophthora oleae TaxID=2107226 RepID=A0ABD3ERS4_9STRA